MTRLPAPLLAAAALLLAAGAVAVCGEAERRLGLRDPGCIVLDEFVAMPLCFLGWQKLAAIVPVYWVWILGLFLFRLLDIFKPLGIRWLQELPGGWGVVVDDLAAAMGACLLLHVGIGVYSLL
jgi:phosphatidylglycerophosphatase A